MGTPNSYDLTTGLDAYGQLWMATLRQALDDAATNARFGEGRANRRDARAWLRAVDTTIGSLQWVCDVIGIPAERVRKEFKHRLRGGTVRRRRGPYPRRHP